MKRSDGREDQIISEHMAALARRSHDARRERLGEEGFRDAMRKLGRKGGRAGRGKSGRPRKRTEV